MRCAAAIALLVVGTAACKEKPQRPPQTAAPLSAVARFTVRDRALATALEARLVRLVLATLDIIDAAPPATGANVDAGAATGANVLRAKQLVAPLTTARAQVEEAVAAISNPADKVMAERVGGVAGRFAEGLAAAVSSDVPIPLEILHMQRELGDTIELYHRSREGWEMENPEPKGPEREFAEARRDFERAESLSGVRSGAGARATDQDLSALRAARQAAAQRAKAAAERLPPTLHAPAARYAAAKEQSLVELEDLVGARDAAESLTATRAGLGAEAEALAALADYFGALAAR